ncbi:MAG: DNA internalization-related competence protein ComEC/Rec2 [Burkholderiales bacterium RIFCSPLOWO2_02_FULL_57_36]|nr:MAG: DNA internalization-related competence protein ComEC/Rec2 [Burkholderiales bacterium RIFCSPLOWO2_02_FULL_57_36]
MRSAILGFVAGVAWLQNQASLPAQSSLWLLAAIAILLGLSARAVRRFNINIPLSIACGAIIGFVWAASVAQHFLSEELPKEWEGRDVTVIGTIDSLPIKFEQGVRFNFLVERVLDDRSTVPMVPSRLALSWYSGFLQEETQAVAEVQPGERWQLTVRLRRPHGNANPYGFDYEVWLLEKKLRATGYVRPDHKSAVKNQRLDRFVISFGNVVERSRDWLRTRIFNALPDKEYAGVIAALVIGDQRAIDQSDWKVFNRTGISHLVSISGLHITMVAGLFAAIVFGLWRRSFFTRASLPAILPAQKAAALAGAGAALIYVSLAGFGVPAQRTLYMLSVVALALWFGRITSVSHVLCIALGVVALLDPWAVLWPGFWLSFGAVAIILYASVGRMQLYSRTDSSRKRSIALVKSAALTQYAVTIGLVPFTMLLFGQVSLVSPVANAVAIPLISFIVTPMSLIGSVLPDPWSGWMLGIAHFFVEWLARVLTWASQLPAAVWTAPIPSTGIFLLALAGTLWLLAPRGWPIRWLGMLAWIPLFVNAPVHPKAGEMWVTAFDVGQGMALLVETERHRLLYDTGPFYSPESDGANRVILPYLKARGIDLLDAVVISHNDNDHSGGALSVFGEIRVGWVASSLALDSAAVRAAPGHRRCAAGQAWSWDGVDFEMLHPTIASYDNVKWKPNARSCTLKISLGGQAVLLPGDIEAAQEAELVASMPEKLRASVLLAPHHGSGTSSTMPFLKAVKPELALFQIGYRNRFRHPKEEIFNRYGALGITRLRNDDLGAITIKIGSQLDYAEYRNEHARYWHGR